MKLTMLGTGNAAVTRCYNTCFVLSEGHQHLLVDGGGGNQILTRLEQAGIPLTEIQDIFVTHKHIDHLLGIVWLVRILAQQMNAGSYRGVCRIYSHSEVISLLHAMADRLLGKKIASQIGRNLLLVPLEDGQETSWMGCQARVFDLQSTKATQFGFTLQLPDGRRLVCSGDEPLPPHKKALAAGADWLLHEAFCLQSQAEVFHPYEKHHSTVADAAFLAEELGIKNLLLYHTEDRNLDHRQELYHAEAQAYFSGRLWIPNDMESLTL